MDIVDSVVESRALAAVKVLSRLGEVRAAYHFGSHVEGTADQWSDIDIAVFMEGVEHWNIHERAAAMALVMKEVGSDVESRLFSISSLNDPPRGGFAQHILRHGFRIFEQHES